MATSALRCSIPGVGILAAGAIFSVAGAALAADPLEYSLEDLLKIDVTGVSRRSQPLHDVAAAIHVITREDIERSGARSIPDLLRTVPGIQVAALGNGRWAVSARGFNGRFANKLQVLMDGRSLYSPLFAGVLWEAEDAPLADIERIEVIRGPGAAMWGANAVNGVINIVTRRARDTVGDIIEARWGTTGSEVFVRHGAALADGHYRVWAKGFTRPESPNLDGTDGGDDWRGARAGFRGDWQLDAGHRIMATGALFRGDMGERYLAWDVASPVGFSYSDKREHNSGGHVLVRYESTLADGSQTTLQAYVDDQRADIDDFLDERRTTYDVDFHHNVRFGERHDLVWGFGHRESRDRIETIRGGLTWLDPARATYRLTNIFAHDEVTLVPDRLRAALGVRLEHNSVTGSEMQPSARLMWTPSARQSVWAALSRASRVPSRAERDASFELAVHPPSALGLPLAVKLTNAPTVGHRLESERAQTREAGYRHVWSSRASLDLVAFRTEYRHLRSAHQGVFDAVSNLFNRPPFVVQYVTPDNEAGAVARGVEVAVEWLPTTWWRLNAAYHHIRVEARTNNRDAVGTGYVDIFEANTPRNQWALRSTMNLEARRQFDLALRHVGAVGRVYTLDSAVPAYTVLDARYAWRLRHDLDVAVGARDLGRRRHGEWRYDYIASETLTVERSAYIQLKWRF